MLTTSAGQTYLFLTSRIPLSRLTILNIKRSVDSMMVTNKIDDWSWIDAIQMAMPSLHSWVMSPAIQPITTVPTTCTCTKLQHGENGLYNPEDQLWWRDADLILPIPNRTVKTVTGRAATVGGGSHGTHADLLPQNELHRIEYETMLVEMCEALKKCSGRWLLECQPA